jgi:osmotically-inducible protein OsmY
MKLQNIALLSLSLCALMLQGCTAMGIATGAGAIAGVSAAKDGGISQSAKDFWISTQISEAWFQYNVETFSKLDLTVKKGRVLVTGIVQDPEHRVEAIRLAWQPQGVEQVINEIRVAESGGVKSFLTDKWITTQIRTKITLDKEVQSINYTIDTVQGTVYLMGVSHSQAETNRIIEIARTISNVQQVVSYIRLIEEIENAQNAVSTAPPPQSQGYDSAPTNTAVSPPISTGAPQPLTGASVPAVEVYPLQ